MITFFNIKTGEKRSIDPSLIDPTFVEPAITALWNSGNLHVNATRGQDFGWRLGAETLKRIQDVQEDEMLKVRIAQSMHRPLEDLNETDILTWLAKDDAAKEAKKNAQESGNFQAQYEQELRAQGVGVADAIPSEPQTALPQDNKSEEELQAEADAAARKNQKSPEQIRKEKEEEDRLMAELEAEEAEEKRKAEEAEAAGSTAPASNQTAAEQNNPQAAKKAVAKSGSKPDNKSNS